MVPANLMYQWAYSMWSLDDLQVTEERESWHHHWDWFHQSLSITQKLSLILTFLQTSSEADGDMTLVGAKFHCLSTDIDPIPPTVPNSECLTFMQDFLCSADRRRCRKYCFREKHDLSPRTTKTGRDCTWVHSLFTHDYHNSLAITVTVRALLKSVPVEKPDTWIGTPEGNEVRIHTQGFGARATPLRASAKLQRLPWRRPWGCASLC